MANKQTSSNIIGWFIIALVLITIGAGSWLVYGEWKRQKDGGIAPPDSASKPESEKTTLDKVVDKVKEVATVITTPKSAFPLIMGARGEEVKRLQHYLNTRYYAGLAEDGIWGSKTSNALFHNEGTQSVSAAEYNRMLNWQNYAVNQNTQSQNLA